MCFRQLSYVAFLLAQPLLVSQVTADEPKQLTTGQEKQSESEPEEAFENKENEVDGTSTTENHKKGTQDEEAPIPPSSPSTSIHSVPDIELEPISKNWYNAQIGLGGVRAGGMLATGLEFSLGYRYQYEKFVFEFSPFELMLDTVGKTTGYQWTLCHVDAMYLVAPREKMTAFVGGGTGLTFSGVQGNEGAYSGGGFDFRVFAGWDIKHSEDFKWTSTLELIVPTYRMSPDYYTYASKAVISPTLLLRTGITGKSSVTVTEVFMWFIDILVD